MEEDIYQKRYLAHQARKAKVLYTNAFGKHDYKKYTKKEQDAFFTILNNRSSQRTFNRETVDLQPILDAINTAPSSCGRKGVFVKMVNDRDGKDLLSGLLVGGTGWVHRADKLLLVIADMDAYKNPVERPNMPYLDAGVVIQTTYLACEAMNYGCCFVNPNVRASNRDFFNERFGIKSNHLFCGVLAVGKFDLKHHNKL